MTQVQVVGAVKRYGALEVIHGVNINVEDGSFVVLVGPSGCGKSTLLRMIAGLEHISDGYIKIGDRIVNDVAAKDRDVAMVFQNYALYPHMTVSENMAFSLRLRGLKPESYRAKVEQAADVLGLGALLDRYPRQLSGGQRQRVAMGRALVRDPKVFLFDEPLSNLDAKLRVTMRTEIKALHQRLKTTIVYVTHDQIEAMTMADKIVVMQDGKVEQIGTPLELYDRPINQFVAGFIGSPAMNFLEGTLINGKFRMDGDVLIDVPRTSAVPDGRVTLGIRPEHLRVDDRGFPVTVLVAEPTGSETQFVTQVANRNLVFSSRERLDVAVGDPIRLLPDVGNVHLFAAADGMRIPH